VPNSTTLSVIVPVRNVAAYLPDMLTSLQRNADPSFEIIVIDDGSTDSTPEVIAEFGEQLALKVIKHETAVGLASARNVGLDVAQGTYVTFLDGDDWIAPDYLPKLVGAIDDLGCDFVRVDHVQVRGRDRVVHRAPEARRGVVLDPKSGIMPTFRSTMVDYPYSWAGVYRRELGGLIRFVEGLHTAEDRPWIWQLHEEAESYAVVSLAGVFYRRQVANSLTQIGDSRQLHFLDAFDRVLSYVADKPEVQPKAIRQFVGVLSHHVGTAARFSRADRRVMKTRGRALLESIPTAALVAAIPRDHRGERVYPLLPAAAKQAWSVA
jgi:glycosyltransferase involved in cell wall biosynthesis